MLVVAKQNHRRPLKKMRARRLRRGCRSSAKSPFAGFNRPRRARWQPQEIRVDGAPASNVDGEAASPREALHAAPPRVRTSPLASTTSTTTQQQQKSDASQQTTPQPPKRPPPTQGKRLLPEGPIEAPCRGILHTTVQSRAAGSRACAAVPPPIRGKRGSPATKRQPTTL